MKTKPSFTYCGLTVVLSNPSRFDKVELLSANGGWFFGEMCLRPTINRYQCEIRTADDKSALLKDTKVVLLLGTKAMTEWLGPLAKDNKLGELRGSVFMIDNIPHIASYFPQDCVDTLNFEKQHNDLHTEDDGDDDEDDESGDDKRRHGYTNRKNFGFWLLKDCEKVKYLLSNPVPTEPKPEYIIYPELATVLNKLLNTKNEYFYFDIETDVELNILCFSFAFNANSIYVVPCLLPDYSHAYSGLWQIYRALAICIRDNIIVAHNGSNFDFYVLANKYHIAIHRCYDTLIAQHRCFPEQEKSLGHCVSLWTWQPFHKDMGDVSYTSLENANQMWQYCGLDVYTMVLIRENIDKYASRMPGLKESIDAANKAIKPYLTATMLGIRYDDSKLKETVAENDKLMMHHLSWIDYLVGKDNLKEIRGKGKSALPTSNLQCCRYFHEYLGYGVVGKGNERLDGTRGPSLGKKNLFKLKLKVTDNPVIDIILSYRELSKESSMLQFTPWRTASQPQV